MPTPIKLSKASYVVDHFALMRGQIDFMNDVKNYYLLRLSVGHNPPWILLITYVAQDLWNFFFQDIERYRLVDWEVATSGRGNWERKIFDPRKYAYSQAKRRQWGLYIKLRKTARTRSPNQNRLYIRIPHK